MDEVQNELGDAVLEVLTMCCLRENRAALEAAAEQRSISFEQLVAAATAHKLSEKFIIRRKRMSGRFSHGQRSRRPVLSNP